MKNLRFLAAAALMAAGLARTAHASPTISHFQQIDCSGAGANFVSGVDAYNDAIFFATFNDRKIYKITNPVDASPSVSVFYDPAVSGTNPTWASGRGLGGLHIDQSTGDVYVCGDTGSAGYVVVLSQAGSRLFETNSLGLRVSAVHPYGAPAGTVHPVVIVPVASSTLRTYTLDFTASPPGTTGTAGTTSAAYSAPYNANLRDVIINGNNLYYFRSTTNPDGVAVHVDTGSDGVLTGEGSTGVYQPGGTNSLGYTGLGYWSYAAESKQFILVPDITNQELDIVNLSGNTLEMTVDAGSGGDLSASIRCPRVATITGKGEFLFVGDANTIEVFSIDGSVPVELDSYSVD